MAADDPAEGDESFPAGEALVRLAKTEERDPVADLLRANIRRRLVGIDEPAHIGRFTTLATIGRGAMGTVLAAFDPVLDRKVALKVIRAGGTSSNAELLREARALARLTHPNVVAVYEADEIDGRIVIAMQFVQGSDLRTWLRERPRAWSEIVPVFAAIARGLAAAHTAGVVHGDLKPENVLVGASPVGNHDVRIADFGTARILADASDGAGGGTPAYLAPERLAGAPASASADQWAFAVSLHEALFGMRPFAGTTIAELRRSERVEVSTGSVPRRIVALVERGLARDPAARWPSMDAIASELVREDRRGRWVVGLVAGTSILAATWFAASRERDPCAASATLWNAETAARVHAAFAASDTTSSEPIAARVHELLERRSDEWTAARREVCEANRVRREESDTLHDLRMRCLDRRAAETMALVDALVDPDHAGELSDAVTAVDDLPELARCNAQNVQDIDYAIPEDVAAQREVAEIRDELDRAAALHALGRYDDARALAQASVVAAEASSFPPVLAEALALLGAAQARVSAPGLAEPTFRRARRIAAEIGNDRLVAEIMVRWLRTVMFADDLARVDELADHARAAALRARASTAEIDAIIGEARLHAGDPDGAIAALELAFTSETRAERRAIVQVSLGSAWLAKGDSAIALQLYEDALAGATAHFGPDHPALGFYLHRVGRGLHAVGRNEDAIATLERVLAMREATLGRDDRAIASILADLAATERALGRLDDAAAHQTRAIAIRTAEYGPDHARVADLHVGLGDIERDRERPDSALVHYRTAARIRETTPGHPQLAAIRERIGEIEAVQR